MTKPFGDTGIGKLNSLIDPIGAAIVTGDKSKLDPLGLVTKKRMPDASKPPAPPQGTKAPNTTPLKRRNTSSGLAGSSTMLTGASGVERSQLNLGGSSLLGG